MSVEPKLEAALKDLKALNGTLNLRTLDRAITDVQDALDELKRGGNYQMYNKPDATGRVIVLTLGENDLKLAGMDVPPTLPNLSMIARQLWKSYQVEHGIVGLRAAAMNAGLIEPPAEQPDTTYVFPPGTRFKLNKPMISHKAIGEHTINRKFTRGCIVRQSGRDSYQCRLDGDDKALYTISAEDFTVVMEAK